MTRKKRLSASERRADIIRKAAGVFAAKGLHGATTREIAEVCSVNEALLYRHFRSKEILFTASIKWLYDEMMNRWLQHISTAPDGMSALCDLISFQVEGLTENPQWAANMVHAAGACKGIPEVEEILAKWFRTGHDYVAGIVRKGIQDGSIQPDVDPDAVAYLIRALVWGFSCFILVGFGKEETGYEPLEVLKNVLCPRLATDPGAHGTSSAPPEA